MKNSRPLLAEVLGTYALVFFGTGAIVINDLYGGMLGHFGIAAAFGMVVIAMIYAFGEVSGAHINPAVTMAFWVAGRFPGKRIPSYLMAQVLGGVAASATLLLLFPDHDGLGATLPSGSIWQSWILEFILSYFLMQVIINVATGSKETGIMAGLAIGVTVWLEALVGGPVCGASMNPVRSLAPALVSGNFSYIWIYLSAPIAGMVLAGRTCKFFKPDGCC